MATFPVDAPTNYRFKEARNCLNERRLVFQRGKAEYLATSEVLTYAAPNLIGPRFHANNADIHLCAKIRCNPTLASTIADIGHSAYHASRYSWTPKDPCKLMLLNLWFCTWRGWLNSKFGGFRRSITSPGNSAKHQPAHNSTKHGQRLRGSQTRLFNF